MNELTYDVIGAAIEVHKNLGPGLLESVYHQCLIHELEIREIQYESEMIVPVIYKEKSIETKLRCDLFIEDILPLEIKSVNEILPIHGAQLMTYMKLFGGPKGLLLNFNVINLFKDGQKTYVNKLFINLPE